jgi:type 1 fimbria pilin
MKESHMVATRRAASIATVILLSAAAWLPMTLAAQTVRFNLTATILPGTCQFAVSDVDLGQARAVDFTGGYVTAWVEVPITSSGCDPLVSRVNMVISGDADPADANLFRGVTGVGVEVQTLSGVTAIRPAGTTVGWSLAQFGSQHNLRARLRQSAATVAAGAISTPITAVVSYN